MNNPKPALKPDTIYLADNGQLICLHCAGSAAKYAGRDISGQKVDACGDAENEYWKREFNAPLKCESGCTQYD